MAYRQAPASEKAAEWPREWQALGPWEGLQCYPAAHGHGQLPLLDYEVCNTRRLLSTQRAIDVLGEGQVPVIPAAWPQQPTDTSSSAGAGQLPPRSALEAREQEWAHQLQARRQQTALPPPQWMRPNADPARVADRQQRAERHNRRGMAGGGPTQGVGLNEGASGSPPGMEEAQEAGRPPAAASPARFWWGWLGLFSPSVWAFRPPGVPVRARCQTAREVLGTPGAGFIATSDVACSAPSPLGLFVPLGLCPSFVLLSVSAWVGLLSPLPLSRPPVVGGAWGLRSL